MRPENYKAVIEEIKPFKVKLLAVSKTKPIPDIQALYDQGQRRFGENKVQELLPKYDTLPKDIQWHLIGHLQTNKVKMIASFISMVESVDSLKLLMEIDKQAAKNNRVINCLLEVYIANENTKFGFNGDELLALLSSGEFKALRNIKICGLMGMATNTSNEEQIRTEFNYLHELFYQVRQQFFAGKPEFKELSMGMSSDYKIALKCGTTMIRIGSNIFGGREYR